MDRNSSKNQKIKGEFISREVYYCVSSMTEYILQKSYEDREAPFAVEDIENYYIDNKEEIEQLQEEIEEIENNIIEKEETIEKLYEQDEDLVNEQAQIEILQNEIEKLEERISEIQNKIEELENEQEEPQEVYEWWIVSNWLLEKLKAYNEPVIEHMNIWGRCCTDQAILLDGVISDICEELEILEGQKNEWKV